MFFILVCTACNKGSEDDLITPPEHSMHMASLESKYLSLDQDQSITSSQVIFSSTINLAKETAVLIQTEGLASPENKGTFNIWISIDGQRYGNESSINWDKSTNPLPHVYNAIALQKLSFGPHLIEVIADHNGDNYSIKAGSNLIIMINPSPTTAFASLAANSPIIDKMTTNFSNPGTIPTTNILNLDIATNGKPLVVLASGVSAYLGDLQGGVSNMWGDAIWGVYMDNQPLGYNIATWGVSDIYKGAETTVPMYLQAFIENTTNTHNLSLEAGEFPWKSGAPLQKLQYRVLENTALIALSGGFTVAGSLQNSLINSGASDYNIHSQWDYSVIGSSEFPHLPAIGESVVLAEGTLSIPEGHNGVVMFSSKIRVQGDSTDLGGKCSLWITIDGNPVGFTGVQELNSPNSESQRTFTASYLATGVNALSPGVHQIKSMVKVHDGGSFKYLSVHRDMPLMWFD